MDNISEVNNTAQYIPKTRTAKLDIFYCKLPRYTRNCVLEEDCTGSRIGRWETPIANSSTEFKQ